MRRIELTIPPALSGQTVEAIARRELRLSRHALTRAKFIEDGILLDNVRVRSNECVRAGQVLSVAIGDAESACEHNRVEAIPGPIDIAFEDEDLVILNKPAGIVMYPYEGIGEATLGNYLMYHLVKSTTKSTAGGVEGAEDVGSAESTRSVENVGSAESVESARSAESAPHADSSCILHPVHRLDRGTSGLVVFAKNAHAQHILQKALHTERFTREYLAICHGQPNPASGCIDCAIARADYRPARFCVREDGKPARTFYTTLQTEAKTPGQIVSLVRLRLETGRTHQIRVHLSDMGCPLLGDEIYGGSTERITRPALHSARIALTHPVAGDLIELSSDLPDDMQVLIGSGGL